MDLKEITDVIDVTKFQLLSIMVSEGLISEDDAKKIYEEYTFIVSDKSIFPSFESNFYDKIQKNKIENIELGVEKLFVTPIKRIKIERKSIKEFNELSDIPNNVLYLKR